MKDKINYLDKVTEFYDFLKGELPEGIGMPNNPKIEEGQAFIIIWYLQEHFRIIPDCIDRCDVCGNLYDSDCSGNYTDNPNLKGHHHFCGIDCESAHDFPVRPISELLKEVKEMISNRKDYSFYDIIIEMYEGNDQINRGERYYLENFFEEKESLYFQNEEALGFINEQIKKQ